MTLCIGIGLIGAGRIAPRAIIDPARELEDARVTAVAREFGSMARCGGHVLDVALSIMSVNDYIVVLRRDAGRCRELAGNVSSPVALGVLEALASECDAAAEKLVRRLLQSS